MYFMNTCFFLHFCPVRFPAQPGDILKFTSFMHLCFFLKFKKCFLSVKFTIFRKYLSIYSRFRLLRLGLACSRWDRIKLNVNTKYIESKLPYLKSSIHTRETNSNSKNVFESPLEYLGSTTTVLLVLLGTYFPPQIMISMKYSVLWFMILG